MTAEQPGLHETARSPCVWVLDEGHPGHLNQSLGLLESMQRQRSLQARTVKTELALPGLLRKPLRAYLGRNGGPALGLLQRCYRRLALPQTPPQLLISSGGGSIPLALGLRRHFGCRHVFLGEVHPYPPALFDILLTPTDQPGAACTIPTELLVNRVSPAACAAQGQSLRERLDLVPGQFVATMLVGGRSRSDQFDEQDWRQVATGMNALSAELGWKWLLTTSRRTGAAAEKALRDTLDADALADVVWWSSAPRKLMLAYLGAADAVFVSGDSLTMISEAVSSGRPVLVLRPRRLRPSRYLEAALDGAIRSARIARIGCAQLPEGAAMLHRLQPLQRAPNDDYASRVLEVLSADPGFSGAPSAGSRGKG